MAGKKTGRTNQKWPIERPPRGPMPIAEREKRRAAMLARWAEKRGAETPEQKAKRERRAAYYRAWRAAQTPEWHALKSARDAEWKKQRREKKQ
jgi:hypothetical protein